MSMSAVMGDPGWGNGRLETSPYLINQIRNIRFTYQFPGANMRAFGQIGRAFRVVLRAGANHRGALRLDFPPPQWRS
jgi:hypothetical protein